MNLTKQLNNTRQHKKIQLITNKQHQSKPFKVCTRVGTANTHRRQIKLRVRGELLLTSIIFLTAPLLSLSNSERVLG